LHDVPPTLLVTSTRHLPLSNTTIFHRALLRADDDAQLVVCESLPTPGITSSFPKRAEPSV